MTKRIRTAVIGTGFMGRVHLEALRRTENVDIAAIAGRNAAVAEKLGSPGGQARSLRETAGHQCGRSPGTGCTGRAKGIT